MTISRGVRLGCSRYGGSPMARQIVLSALITSLTLSSVAAAAPISWNGGAGDWTDTMQWSGGVVPYVFDDVSIDGGKGGIASDVTVNALAEINDLQVDAGDRIAIESSIRLRIGAGGAGAVITNDGDIALEDGIGAAATYLDRG